MLFPFEQLFETRKVEGEMKFDGYENAQPSMVLSRAYLPSLHFLFLANNNLAV